MKAQVKQIGFHILHLFPKLYNIEFVKRSNSICYIHFSTKIALINFFIFIFNSQFCTNQFSPNYVVSLLETSSGTVKQ